MFPQSTLMSKLLAKFPHELQNSFTPARAIWVAWTFSASNSATDSARELYEPPKDAESLAVSILENKHFWVLIFVEQRDSLVPMTSSGPVKKFQVPIYSFFK